jgi:hypothetical protein
VTLLTACGADRNQAPTASLSAGASEVALGDEITLDGTASTDPDGDPLLFRWSVDAPQGSAVDLSGERAQTVSFTPDILGTYTVRLSVDDGEFESEPVAVTVEATGSGAPVADAGDDQSVEVGAEVTLDGTGSSDPNGDALSYQWSIKQPPPGSSAALDDPSAAQPTFTADVAGDYIIALVVSDGELESQEDTVTISAGSGNLPPQADAGEDQTADVGREVVLEGGGTDPDSSELTYFWSFVSRPTGSNAAISGAVTDTARFTPDVEGTYEIELKVSDEESSDTDTVVVTAETSVSTTCLLISEYIEGSGDNKAVELYNCDNAPIDLSGFGLCVVSNANTTCTNYDIALDGELPAGDVLTLCNTGLDSAVYDPANCDVVDGSVNFNGNDRIVVYEDVDDSDDFGTGDIPADAFGEITNVPSSATIWSDTTLRRCDFERLDGASGFDFTQYFVEAATDDFSDFGQAPTEGCP